MSSKPDDSEMLISKYRTMNIEELKESIDNWKGDKNCANQIQSLNIAKNELGLKYKERQEQIELLTKSLASSSRLSRWISSIRSILNQFVVSRQ
jgi:hypothetical protein